MDRLKATHRLAFIRRVDSCLPEVQFRAQRDRRMGVTAPCIYLRTA
jgi:hypothetical protein